MTKDNNNNEAKEYSKALAVVGQVDESSYKDSTFEGENVTVNTSDGNDDQDLQLLPKKKKAKGEV